MFQDKQAVVMSEPDAVTMLIADHREAKALLEQYEGLVRRGADGERRHALAEAICVMLTVHTTAEEELFHPAAFGAIGTQGALDEATAQRHRLRHLIADIMNMNPADPLFDASVKVLGEHVDHHVQDEEGALFPKVRASSLDLRSLGARIAKRKDELMAEMEEVEA